MNSRFFRLPAHAAGARLVAAFVAAFLTMHGAALAQDVIDLGAGDDSDQSAPASPAGTPAPSAPDTVTVPPPPPGNAVEPDTVTVPPAAGAAPAAAPTGTPIPPEPNRIANPVAVFSGLDKITGRITSFDVYIDETVQFGSLQVTPRVCYDRPPTEAPETDAFVEVDDIGIDRKVRRIFTGWMFAASPGLHAVDHPVYDVWLTDCKMKSNVPPPKK